MGLQAMVLLVGARAVVCPVCVMVLMLNSSGAAVFPRPAFQCTHGYFYRHGPLLLSLDESTSTSCLQNSKLDCTFVDQIPQFDP